MPRISDIEILHLPERPVLRIRQRTSVEKLPEVIGNGFARLAQYLNEVDGLLVAIPFVAYSGIDPADMGIDICFPLLQAKPGRGDIESVMLPTETIAVCMYLGSYAETGEVHEEMRSWIAANGYTSAEASYEHYYNGQGYPEELFLTKIEIPVERESE